MRGAGALLLLLGVAFAARSSSSSSSSSSGNASTPSGEPLTPTPSGEPPQATRTGFTGRDAWKQYILELEPLARAQLRAEGANEVESIVGAHALSALAMSEHSGRAEYDYNVGNVRPTGTQARSRWPNGMLYRSFPSRAEGAKELLRILRNRRYGPAWRAMVAAVGEGAAIEPIVAAWFAAIHDAGYTDGPPATELEARARWQSEKLATGAAVADLVTRALANQGAPWSANTISAAPTDTLVSPDDNALFRVAREQLEQAEAAAARLRDAIARE